MELDAKIRERLDTYLASKGLRRTKQRDVLLAAAFGTTDHFTADELLAMAQKLDPTVSRATMYRTLTLLVEGGLLHEIDLGRGQTYYDPNFIEKPQHNHLICTDCDRVVEFEDDHIALLEDCITRRLGFKASSKSIRIQASCEELARTGACTSRRIPVGG
jgi:Fur family transcriptional regulator, ferric uptake regulator